mmetsp:Transcript_15557/g.26370  ORF Transcript_15557/g.26370 Transcript_15557/m.26370 type:complete len:232 (+) Transcript_15557:227-922(+)
MNQFISRQFGISVIQELPENIGVSNWKLLCSQPHPDIWAGHDLPELVLIEDSIPGFIGCCKESPHLLRVQHSVPLLLAHHELVIRCCDLEGFLHKHGVDNSNCSEADDQLVGYGKDGIVLSNIFLQNSSSCRPIREGEFEHCKHCPAGRAKILEDLMLLMHRLGLVPEVAVQGLVQCESDQGLHHYQQHKRPEKNRDAALHGRCHDVQGIKALYCLDKPQKPKHPSHSQHS